MQDVAVSLISITGTSTTLAETGERIFNFTINAPFLIFLAVAIIFFAAFVVFMLFFKHIWAD